MLCSMSLWSSCLWNLLRFLSWSSSYYSAIISWSYFFWMITTMRNTGGFYLFWRQSCCWSSTFTKKTTIFCSNTLRNYSRNSMRSMVESSCLMTCKKASFWLTKISRFCTRTRPFALFLVSKKKQPKKIPSGRTVLVLQIKLYLSVVAWLGKFLSKLKMFSCLSTICGNSIMK